MAVALGDIQKISALGAFSEEQLKLLGNLLIRRHYAAGELIFLEGDPSKGLWFVLAGRVRIIKMSAGGRVQALCVMHSGKCFGGCPLFNMEANPANAQALEDVTLLILPKEETEYLQAHNPDLMRMLLYIYTERMALLARLSESLGTWSVNARINDMLLQHVASEDGAQRVYFTHEKLAHLVGTVREVVTRHLNSLEEQGIISQNQGLIEILDADELQSACLVGQI